MESNQKQTLTSKSKDTKTEDNKKNRTFTVSGVNFAIDERYEFNKQIGVGSYSIVCSCYDKKEGRNVAVKKVTNVFDDLNDARRILREMKLLRFLNHENIVSFKEAFNRKGNLYLVFEFIDKNLLELLEQISKENKIDIL